MEERSRIKFSPQSGEFEIEGSEAFVKKYFVKIQEMCSTFAVSSVTTAKPRGAKVENARVAKGPGKKRRSNVNVVLDLIYESKKGVSTTQLKERTGLTERQIWGVIYRAERAGKIRKAARGLYAAA